MDNNPIYMNLMNVIKQNKIEIFDDEQLIIDPIHFGKGGLNKCSIIFKGTGSVY